MAAKVAEGAEGEEEEEVLCWDGSSMVAGIPAGKLLLSSATVAVFHPIWDE